MCDRMASWTVFNAENLHPANAAEDLLGVPEDANSPQEAEVEEPGSMASSSALGHLSNSPQSSSAMAQTLSLGSGDGAEGPSPRTRQSRRIPSNRSSTRGFEASLEAMSQSNAAATKDAIAFLRDKVDKEFAIAQQKADADAMLARTTALERKTAVMIQLKEQMDFSTEECLKFIKDNGI